MLKQSCNYIGFKAYFEEVEVLLCSFFAILGGVRFLQHFMKTTENGLNGNVCPHLHKKWLKLANLGHFKRFSQKVEESKPP